MLSQVQINGRTLAATDLARLERFLGARIPAGAYWYDPRSGAWGPMGAGAAGLIAAGLPLGAPPPDCSGTGSDVFLNGREASMQEVLQLAALVGPVPPGRYFLEANGNAGPEGGATVVNLLAAARRAGAGTLFSQSATGSIVSGLHDPDGGSMVTVRDASGKTITWCP